MNQQNEWVSLKSGNKELCDLTIATLTAIQNQEEEAKGKFFCMAFWETHLSRTSALVYEQNNQNGSMFGRINWDAHLGGTFMDDPRYSMGDACNTVRCIAGWLIYHSNKISDKKFAITDGFSLRTMEEGWASQPLSSYDTPATLAAELLQIDTAELDAQARTKHGYIFTHSMLWHLTIGKALFLQTSWPPKHTPSFEMPSIAVAIQLLKELRDGTLRARVIGWSAYDTSGVGPILPFIEWRFANEDEALQEV